MPRVLGRAVGAPVPAQGSGDPPGGPHPAAPVPPPPGTSEALCMTSSMSP
jgi:hypothetical protein